MKRGEKLPPSAQQRQRNADPIKDSWRTPQTLWENINKRFNFGLDVAADDSNAKVPFYYTEDTDALSCSWAVTDRPVWCNPPFSIKNAFVSKAVEEMTNGVCTVMILPALPDISWFHTHVLGVAQEIWYFKGRVQYESPFDEEKNGCTFPSMLVVWDGTRQRGNTCSGSLTSQGLPILLHPGMLNIWGNYD